MIPDRNDSVNDSVTEKTNTSFICGVVEGFYGQPWTVEQRRKLFTRMAWLDMNTYIYAPKDDLKHRMHWRDLYTVDEAEPLTTLIDAAREAGVTFVYAISPGLDITYSSSKDVICLKHKLEQVASFGCEAFAILFDDIDVELCDADKSLYQSFASAQVSVTNEVYQHLHQPSKFFFCPTEYCASRAVPSVSQSEYLNTVGTKLLPDIDVMWTGPKVISKRITIHSVEEISRVLRRQPLIWDNIHANDYDPKRLFLGPYDGRSPRLVPYVRGVLTNPNCEFESDFIALHTLAQWSRAREESSSQGKKDFILRGCPGNADVRLETEGSSTDDDDELEESSDNSAVTYAPRQALRQAVTAWLPDFFVVTAPSSSALRKPVPGVIPPPVIPPPVPSLCIAGNKAVSQMAILEVADAYIQPLPAAVPTSSLQELSESETESSVSSSVVDVEPMDCAVTPGTTPASVDSAAENCSHSTSEDNDGSDTVVSCDESVSTENIHSTETMQIDSEIPTSLSTSITVDDIMTVVDMFYLPFEHGPRAVRLLSDFFDIKLQAADSLADRVTYDSGDQLLANCCDDCDSNSSDKFDSNAKSSEWHELVQTFLSRLQWISDVIDRILAIPNKALAYELFPYLWDIKAAIRLLDCFVRWLADCAKLSPTSRYYLYGSPFTWANKFYRDQLMCREQEPWLFRGGLLGEIQRMLPFENCPDLLFYPFPADPQANMYRVRPYKATDKESVYNICKKTYNDGDDGSHLCTEYTDLLADKAVGPFLAHSAEHCFVVMDQLGTVCGYVVTAPNANSFCDNVADKWLPYLQQKYPLPDVSTDQSAVTDIIASFHSPSKGIRMPADHCQSVLRMDILSQWKDNIVGDISIAKRALACVVASLKVCGSQGICTTLSSTHVATLEMYRTLGFTELSLESLPLSSGLITLGRPI